MAFYLPYCFFPGFRAYLEKRPVLRWLVRILFYLAIWTLLYAGVYAGEALEEYRYLIVFAVVVLYMLAIGFIALYKGPRKKEAGVQPMDKCEGSRHGGSGDEL